VACLRAGLAWVRAKVPLELADAAEQGRLLGLAEPVGPGDFGLVQSGQEAFEGFLSAAGHLDQDAAAVGRHRFGETRTGLDHVSFSVGSRDELTEWEKTLRDRGVPVSAISDQPWGSVLVFRDPDNIQLELFFMEA